MLSPTRQPEASERLRRRDERRFFFFSFFFIAPMKYKAKLQPNLWRNRIRNLSAPHTRTLLSDICNERRKKNFFSLLPFSTCEKKKHTQILMILMISLSFEFQNPPDTKIASVDNSNLRLRTNIWCKLSTKSQRSWCVSAWLKFCYDNFALFFSIDSCGVAHSHRLNISVCNHNQHTIHFRY